MRLLKESTGQNFGEIIRDLKLRKAAELLANRDSSIPEVMEAVGYSDVSAFAVNFTLGSFIPLVKIGNAFAYVAAALCFPLLLKLTQTLCSK